MVIWAIQVLEYLHILYCSAVFAFYLKARGDLFRLDCPSVRYSSHAQRLPLLRELVSSIEMYYMYVINTNSPFLCSYPRPKYY